MQEAQQKVKEFMLQARQHCPHRPIFPDADIRLLRVSLIGEELIELATATDRVSSADAIADLLYVVLGSAVAYGIDITPIFDEVHRSNMTKFIDGSFRLDGKYIKGPSYEPANILPLLNFQILRP